MNVNKILAKFDIFLDDKISPLNSNHKAAICVALLLIPVAVFYFLYFSPKNKEIAQLNRRQVALEREIKKVEERTKELDKFKQEKKETEAKFKEASEMLPQQQEIPALLTNISSLGTNSGLDVVTFRPGGETVKEFYAVIPISISVRGSYHTVGVFLDKVSKLPRIVSVSSLSLGGPRKEDNEMVLNASLQLVTYRFLEPQNAK